MKLIQFIRQEVQTPPWRLAAMAVFSSLGNVMILVVINAGIQHAVEDAHKIRPLILFVLATVLYIVSQRYLMIETWTELERALKRVRMRIVNKIRQCDLEPLETIGRGQIYTSLSRETQTISQSSLMLVMALQALVLVCFAVVYVAWLSMIAFVTFVVVSVVAVAVQIRNIAALERGLLNAMEGENRLLDSVNHILDGFIELKMNPQRANDLFDHLDEQADAAATQRIASKRSFAKMAVFGQTMLYVLVAAMIFIVPRLSETYNDVIVQAATAMLFLAGPISTVVGAIPEYANSNAAILRLEALEAELENATRRQSSSPEVQFKSFENISLEGIVFQFHQSGSERPFTLGPVDLALKKGEVLFLIGGNGSGKSTLLRLLTALYEPNQGFVRVDGEPITEKTLQAYRNLFSVIFSDFHLFDRLYGMPEIEEQEVTALLEAMELAHKTHYRDGQFSTLNLSTGQRKRLAYIISLIEDRPIYVFDEWAAEQDPEFRERFYRELVPELRERGKTILAVTHDDRYWDVADRLLKMDEGRLVEA